MSASPRVPVCLWGIARLRSVGVDVHPSHVVVRNPQKLNQLASGEGESMRRTLLELSVSPQSSYASSNNTLERERSAKSGTMTTMVLPTNSGRAPTVSGGDGSVRGDAAWNAFEAGKRAAVCKAL